MGTIDRGLRAVLGIVLIWAGLAPLAGGALGWILAAIGLVFIVTSAAGYCPLYSVIGVSTCKRS